MSAARLKTTPVPDPGFSAGGETLRDWLDFAVRRYQQADLALGQVAVSAHDEALYLLLRTLGLPLDSGIEILNRRISAAERSKLSAMLRRRVAGRVPAAYLTGEAWLGEHRFSVDKRVIIPRSYFLEIIPKLKLRNDVAASVNVAASGHVAASVSEWSASTRSRSRPRIADVGTGSGCLAILLAHRFPGARVDAIDVSPSALAVARVNVRAHRLASRIHLFRSHVFDAVPRARYDLILSNPPYEPSSRMDHLPPEFRREPRLALDGGRDGLDVIRKLLRQAPTRLNPDGRVLIEVGGLRAAINREFASLRPRWLRTQDGSDCVCEIEAARLMT